MWESSHWLHAFASNRTSTSLNAENIRMAALQASTLVSQFGPRIVAFAIKHKSSWAIDLSTGRITRYATLNDIIRQALDTSQVTCQMS